MAPYRYWRYFWRCLDKKRITSPDSKKSKELVHLLKQQQSQFHSTILMQGMVREGLVSEEGYSIHKQALLESLTTFNPSDSPELTRSKLLFLQDLLQEGCINDSEYHKTKRPILQRLAQLDAVLDARDFILTPTESYRMSLSRSMKKKKIVQIFSRSFSKSHSKGIKRPMGNLSKEYGTYEKKIKDEHVSGGLLGTGPGREIAEGSKLQRGQREEVGRANGNGAGPRAFHESPFTHAMYDLTKMQSSEKMNQEIEGVGVREKEPEKEAKDQNDKGKNAVPTLNFVSRPPVLTEPPVSPAEKPSVAPKTFFNGLDPFQLLTPLAENKNNEPKRNNLMQFIFGKGPEPKTAGSQTGPLPTDVEIKAEASGNRITMYNNSIVKSGFSVGSFLSENENPIAEPDSEADHYYSLKKGKNNLTQPSFVVQEGKESVEDSVIEKIDSKDNLLGFDDKYEDIGGESTMELSPPPHQSRDRETQLPKNNNEKASSKEREEEKYNETEKNKRFLGRGVISDVTDQVRNGVSGVENKIPVLNVEERVPTVGPSNVSKLLPPSSSLYPTKDKQITYASKDTNTWLFKPPKKLQDASGTAQKNAEETGRELGPDKIPSNSKTITAREQDIGLGVKKTGIKEEGRPNLKETVQRRKNESDVERVHGDHDSERKRTSLLELSPNKVKKNQDKSNQIKSSSLSENIQFKLFKLREEICSNNSSLNPNEVLSNEQIITISIRMPADKAELLKFFPKDWIELYGSSILRIVQKEVKRHVLSQTSLQTDVSKTKVNENHQEINTRMESRYGRGKGKIANARDLEEKEFAQNRRYGQGGREKDMERRKGEEGRGGGPDHGSRPSSDRSLSPLSRGPPITERFDTAPSIETRMHASPNRRVKVYNEGNPDRRRYISRRSIPKADLSGSEEISIVQTQSSNEDVNDDILSNVINGRGDDEKERDADSNEGYIPMEYKKNLSERERRAAAKMELMKHADGVPMRSVMASKKVSNAFFPKQKNMGELEMRATEKRRDHSPNHLRRNIKDNNKTEYLGGLDINVMKVHSNVAEESEGSGWGSARKPSRRKKGVPKKDHSDDIDGFNETLLRRNHAALDAQTFVGEVTGAMGRPKTGAMR